jgi:hypothetical protein
MPDVTIYHNPACGTSRNTLALIRNAGVAEPVFLPASMSATTLPDTGLPGVQIAKRDPGKILDRIAIVNKPQAA